MERTQKNQGDTYTTTTTTLPINEYGDKLQMADGFGGGDTIMLFTPHARVYLLIELTALSGEKKSKERTIFLPKTPPLWKVILLLHSKVIIFIAQK